MAAGLPVILVLTYTYFTLCFDSLILFSQMPKLNRGYLLAKQCDYDISCYCANLSLVLYQSRRGKHGSLYIVAIKYISDAYQPKDPPFRTDITPFTRNTFSHYLRFHILTNILTAAVSIVFIFLLHLLMLIK